MTDSLDPLPPPARPTPARPPVGRPVHVVQTDNPSTEQLVETQQRYIDELLRIWETYKVSERRAPSGGGGGGPCFRRALLAVVLTRLPVSVAHGRTSTPGIGRAS